MTSPVVGNSLTPRAARLAAELETWGRRTITLAELWTLYARADPASATRPTRRADLAAAVTALAAAGVVTASKTLDRTVAPPLPARLTLPPPTTSVSAAALARSVPWRPELAWAATARLTVGQVSLLQTVNTWLRDRGRDTDVIPVRERSLELFGYEKTLDTLRGTILFAAGRLTLTLLRTFRAHPPLPVRRVGDGSILLVVENADTFDTLRKTLNTTTHAVGHIAWGAGAAFEASVLSVGELPDVHDIAYFGDLDADGLRIPASAALTVASEHLPAVRPAHGLYRLLVEHGIPQPGQPPVDEQRAADLAGWLDDTAARPAQALLTGGSRIPQEAVSAKLLTSVTGDWLADLS
ncbi:Wadjet anti-phage system protein JetD domain-containing protein [Actinoplanes sp. NPDC024001]|uniref:Wadjet anti-phage system protein JetD domain-containing protein n=1 Tax=Actinoplanes sp. NPDC024001 TaxID=3154598 RepID=UPI0033DC215E